MVLPSMPTVPMPMRHAALEAAMEDGCCPHSHPGCQLSSPTNALPGIVSGPISGVRCPTCLKAGKEVWVIPGRHCGYCGTPCG